jgi:hypothetical protein
VARVELVLDVVEERLNVLDRAKAGSALRLVAVRFRAATTSWCVAQRPS